LGVT
jgi:hypothetical protein